MPQVSTEMLVALIYMLIIQQIDGNILYPRIVGSVMKVHPITHKYSWQTLKETV